MLVLKMVLFSHLTLRFGANFAEFYPLYDGLYRCSGTDCTKYWLSESNFQNQAKACTNPPLTNIILSSSPQSQNNIILNTSAIPLSNALEIKFYYGQNHISLDIYFIEAWLEGQVLLLWDQSQIQINYSTSNQFFTKGLCNSVKYTVKTYKFKLNPFNKWPYLKIISQSGQIGLRNIHIYYPKCYYLCRTCFGPQKNQCITCNNGQPPVNNACTPCSVNRPFIDLDFCARSCEVTRVPSKDSLCLQKLSRGTLVSRFQAERHFVTYANKLSILFDQNLPINYFPFYQDKCYTLNYGPFSGSQGLLQTLQLSLSLTKIIHIKFHFDIINELSQGSSISFFLDDQFYGAFYQNGNTLEGRAMLIVVEVNYGYQSIHNNFNKCRRVEVILPIREFPRSKVILKIIGDLKQPGLEAWGLKQIYTYALSCPNCSSCSSISVDCYLCKSGFTLFEGQCYDAENCGPQFLKIENQCLVPTAIALCIYSTIKDASYYLRVYYNFSPYPLDSEIFDLVSEEGLNFQKGDTHSSYTFERRVFGGPYVWASAVFKKQYLLSKPHYKVTVAFKVIFGENFTDGKFTYQIENNDSVQIDKSQCETQQNLWGNPEPEFVHQVYFELEHSSQTLDIKVECSGPNNNILDAYCGLFDYFIILHEVTQIQAQCHPLCLQCNNSNSCLSYDSSFHSIIHTIDSTSCPPRHFHDKESLTCLLCVPGCLSCIDLNYCMECKSSFTFNSGECTCGINQFFDENYEACKDCENHCQNCISSTVCTGCNPQNKRILIDNQCPCQAGYFESDQGECKLCARNCRECTGPAVTECSACFNNLIVSDIGCQCESSWYFDQAQGICQRCHEYCLECWGSDKNQCLHCDAVSDFRMIQGFSCVCITGYFEDSNQDCMPCPIEEAILFVQCYKSCGNKGVIWHNELCQSTDCLIAENLVEGSCLPICGDGIIHGFEQCDDQNETPYDGCYKCMNMDLHIKPVERNLECNNECGLCFHGYCYQCKSPDHFINQQSRVCEVHCNDKIVTKNEQCDDYNTIMYDGCYQCKFSCSLNCLQCNKGACQICDQGYQIALHNRSCQPICGDGLIVPEEDCDDQNLDTDDGCHQCQFFCPQNCQLCFKGDCLYCKRGYKLDDRYRCEIDDRQAHFTLPKFSTGIGIILWNQENIYCSVSPLHNCLPCQNQIFGLSNIFGNCASICGDHVLTSQEECEQDDKCNDMCILECEENCLLCERGKCKICDDQFILNDDGYCNPICGNNIIQRPQEDCEDMNDVPYDGCYLCRYQCEEPCLVCGKGICQLCKSGYYLENEDRLCKALCGDGLVVGDEECDDQNLDDGDGCFLCKLECDRNCFRCELGVCLQCEEFWNLQKNRCLPECGNLIVQYPYEECEDGNLLRYDGCFNCMYDCNENCIECIQAVCYVCKLGFRIFENDCEPYCGDGIQIGKEECDDMNDEAYDGCFDCLYDCHQFCKSCSDGICLECEQGFLNLNNRCEPICGDGVYLPEYEACDDGNLDAQDGCSQRCEIESDWFCDQETHGISTCFVVEKPILQLVTLMANNERQIVQLTFNQLVRLKTTTLADIVEIDIYKETVFYGFSYTLQTDTLIQINELRQLILKINLLFNQSVISPILRVSIKPNQISNIYDQDLDGSNQLYLSDCEILSATEKQLVIQSGSIAEALVISIMALGAVTFFMGDINILLNLFDLIQFLTYMKYTNIKFPRNLELYFEIFQYIEPDQICEALKINQIYGVFNHGEAFPVLETSNKFQQDSINALFLQNIVILVIQLLAINFVCNFFSLIIKAAQGFDWKKFTKVNKSEKYKLYIIKLLIFLKSLSNNSTKFYNELLASNIYNLAMAIFLQIFYAHNLGTFIIINTSLAYVCLFYLIHTCLIQAQKQVDQAICCASQKLVKPESFVKQRISRRTFQAQLYLPISTLKKASVIFYIVCLQNQSFLQQLSLIASSHVYLGYLVYFRPISDKEWLKQQLIETIILISYYLFLLLTLGESFGLEMEDKKFIGWLIIFTYSILLTTTLAFDIINQGKKIITYLSLKFKILHKNT